MYYKLCGDVALRSYSDNETGYYRLKDRHSSYISAKGYELLTLCDGAHDIKNSGALALLVLQGLIEPCEKGDALARWQRRRICDNPCFPSLNWAITQKCNYNCRHCFMASDNMESCAEFSWEDCLSLIDGIEKCGIWRVSLTGGEPLMHPRFPGIIRELSSRGISVFEIATNGALIDSDTLELLSSLGQAPLIKISFDGLGYHDRMRGTAGAEEAAIDAIRLCRAHGFAVRVQMNINRENAAIIPESLDAMEKLGVEQVRVIRTSEAPRWNALAPNASLDYIEYFDGMLPLLRRYIEKPRTMRLTLWQFVELDPVKKLYHNRPVKFCRPISDGKLPACPSNRLMLSVTGAGELVPCNQMEGVMREAHMSIGNVLDTDLQTLLNDKACRDVLLLSISDIMKSNPEKCGVCRFRALCGGGCGALALGLCGDIRAYDPLKCAFFEGGYLEKIAEVFRSAPDWRTSDELHL